MLINDDIQKIIAANREVFATKENLEEFREEMRKDFSDLQKIAEKIGVKLEY